MLHIILCKYDCCKVKFVLKILATSSKNHLPIKQDVNSLPLNTSI